MGICKQDLYLTLCVLNKDWSVRCWMCILLFLGIGIVAPISLVVIFYIHIHSLVRKARLQHQSLTATQSTRLSSSRSDSDAAKESVNKTERRRYPWSILVVVALNVTATIPWTFFIGAPEVIYGSSRLNTGTFVLVDALYAILLIATSTGPLAYLLTTKTVRDQTVRLLKSAITCGKQ